MTRPHHLWNSPSSVLNASSGRKQEIWSDHSLLKVHLRRGDNRRRPSNAAEKSSHHLVWSQVTVNNIAHSQLLTWMDHVGKKMTVMTDMMQCYGWKSLRVMHCHRVRLQKTLINCKLLSWLCCLFVFWVYLWATRANLWPGLQQSPVNTTVPNAQFVITVCGQTHKNSSYSLCCFSLCWQANIMHVSNTQMYDWLEALSWAATRDSQMDVLFLLNKVDE